MRQWMEITWCLGVGGKGEETDGVVVQSWEEGQDAGLEAITQEDLVGGGLDVVDGGQSLLSGESDDEAEGEEEIEDDQDTNYGTDVSEL